MAQAVIPVPTTTTAAQLDALQQLMMGASTRRGLRADVDVDELQVLAGELATGGVAAATAIADRLLVDRGRNRGCPHIRRPGLRVVESR